MRAKRLDAAREQFERAAKAQPGFVDAQSNLGSVLRQLGRVPDSVAPLKRAFAGNAKSAEIADLLGASLLDTGDSRGAVAVFEASVKTRPRDAQCWVHLAIAPDTVKALGARGQALARLGDTAGARDAFATGVRVAPRDAVAQHNFGVFLRDQGEFEPAIERLRSAVQLDAALTPAHEALVGALVEAGRSDEAMRQGRAFAQAHPDTGAGLAMLATAHFAQERIEESVEAYRRSAQGLTGAELHRFSGLVRPVRALQVRDTLPK